MDAVRLGINRSHDTPGVTSPPARYVPCDATRATRKSEPYAEGVPLASRLPPTETTQCTSRRRRACTTALPVGRQSLPVAGRRTRPHGLPLDVKRRWGQSPLRFGDMKCGGPMCGTSAAQPLSRGRVRQWWIAVGSVVAFTALAVIVDLGLLNTFDSIIREWARPDDVWGRPSFEPTTSWKVCARPSLQASSRRSLWRSCVKRRSLRPAVLVGAVWLVTVALTVAAKMAVGRPDTSGSADNLGEVFLLVTQSVSLSASAWQSWWRSLVRVGGCGLYLRSWAVLWARPS